MATPKTKPLQKNTIIAFDYGTKKIGVALGNYSLKTANPLCILKARDGIPNWQDIEQLIEQWQPVDLLVGLPLNMDDSENEICVRARKFAKRLHGRYGLKVHLFDERLSSREAISQLEAQGKYSPQKPIDDIAAQLLLESWLNAQK